MNVFDYVNAISYTKEDLFDGQSSADKEYIPYIVNRAFSYHADSVLFANEINKYADIPKKWQFDFLRNSITKRRRYSKWVKKDQELEIITRIQELYKYSLPKAIETYNLLSDPERLAVLNQMSKGGKHEY